MDDKFYTDILEQNKEAVRSAVVASMLESVKRELSWELPQSLKKAIGEFIEQEVIPSVRAQLLEDKEEIVASATAIIRSVPAEIGKAMQKQLAETLTSSYKLRKITSALFD